ncbi:hypothetical protein BGZ51_003159 [Haplosporangium sp. Z 767]|nr:hypothetical protein BGZ51_003159 [Haplosporangium sp. Z 767]KAF9189066.1 hypothetical protein BGZ50_000966 [Haplosporangium sp. Z 11]
MYEQVSSNPSSTPVTSTATAGQGSVTLQNQQLEFAQEFWEEQIITAEQFNSDFKNHPLPLARIKKVMKSDPEVKMISAEAPILFSKACEIFICEVTRRAWMHAEESKRRTLQRSDVAIALSKSDQFDFLIDIVPREEPPKAAKRSSSAREDPAPSAEAYEEQQEQQPYGSYYAQGAGGIAGYVEPSFYQSMTPEQFQQYIQYQQQQQQQQTAAQTYQAQQQQHNPSSNSRGDSAGYAEQEPSPRQS